MAEKIIKSFRLSKESFALLDALIAKRNQSATNPIRSQANMIEVLIKEAAAKEKIKVPK